MSQLNQKANHDLLRAVHCAYLQATLQLCALYGHKLGINSDAWIRRETLLDLLKRAEEILRPHPQVLTTIFGTHDKTETVFVKWVRDHWSLVTVQTLLKNNEVAWLDSLSQALRQKINSLDKSDEVFLPAVLTKDLDVLLIPTDKITTRVNDLRGMLIGKVLEELKASDKNSSMPEEFEYELRERWFDLFCSCFQYILKNDKKVNAIFTNHLLVNMKVSMSDKDEDDLTLKGVQSQLEYLGGEWVNKLNDAEQRLKQNQQEGFHYIKEHFEELLPIVAVAENINTTVNQLPFLILATKQEIVAEIASVASVVQTKGEEIIQVFDEGKKQILDGIAAIKASQSTTKSLDIADKKKGGKRRAGRDHIERIYIYAQTIVKNLSSLDRLQLQVELKAKCESRVESLSHLIEEHARLVITGTRGMGKTTFMKQILRSLCLTLKEEVVAQVWVTC